MNPSMNPHCHTLKIITENIIPIGIIERSFFFISSLTFIFFKLFQVEGQSSQLFFIGELKGLTIKLNLNGELNVSHCSIENDGCNKEKRIFIIFFCAYFFYLVPFEMSSKTGINSFALWRQSNVHGKSATANANHRNDQNKYLSGQSTIDFEYDNSYGTHIDQFTRSTPPLLRPLGIKELSKHDILRYDRGECLSGVFASRKRVPSRDCSNNTRYR